MDPSPDEILALADHLTQLAKNVASAQDPMSRKHQTAALVMQAKQLIAQVQDPFDALMDHIVNVSYQAMLFHRAALLLERRLTFIQGLHNLSLPRIFETWYLRSCPAYGHSNCTGGCPEMRCSRGADQYAPKAFHFLKIFYTDQHSARLMRQLTCVNIFNEVRVGEWAHNRLSIVHSEHMGAMSGKYLYIVS